MMSDGASATVWVAAVAGPLLVAVCLPCAALRRAALALAPWAALPALAAGLAAPPPVVLPGVLLEARMGVEEAGRAFLVFSAALWLAAGAYARRYLEGDPARHRFFACYLAAMAGNVGLIAAADLVLFYTCFALMSFASYGLVVHTGTPEARQAGLVYLVLVVVGELLVFSGLVLWARTVGELETIGWRRTAAAMPGPVATSLLLLGFGIKAGMLPLHVWLPLAHPVAPTPASAVLSGAMIKAGLLGWIRFLPLGEAALPALGTWCVAAGVAAALGAATAGVFQRDPKVALAYSSISQMGFMTVAIGAGLASPGAWPLLLPAILLYAAHHAAAKGALFLGVGVAAHPGRSSWARGAVAAGLLLPALALAGAPVTSGGLAKLVLKDALSGAWGGTYLPLLLSGAAVGSTVLMARVLWLALAPAPERPRAGGAPAGLWLPWIAVTAATAGPALGAAAGALHVGPLPSTLRPDAAWSLSWPVLAGLLLFGLARRLWPASRPAPQVLPGDVLHAVVALVGRVRRPRLPRTTLAPSLRGVQAAVVARVWSGVGAAEHDLAQWRTTGFVVLGLLAALGLIAGW